jgi:hypothetical protein
VAARAAAAGATALRARAALGVARARGEHLLRDEASGGKRSRGGGKGKLCGVSTAARVAGTGRGGAGAPARRAGVAGTRGAVSQRARRGTRAARTSSESATLLAHSRQLQPSAHTPPRAKQTQ